jgi:hypothetical protein
MQAMTQENKTLIFTVTDRNLFQNPRHLSVPERSVSDSQICGEDGEFLLLGGCNY